MQLLSTLQSKKPKTIFNTPQFDVLEINRENKIQQKPKLLVLPYFIEDATVLLRYENIDTFNISRPEIDKFVQICECEIESDKNDTLTVCLKEKFGLTLKNDAKPNFLNPIFLHKDNTTILHICILPLMSYMYEQEMTSDKDSNIIVSLSDLNNVIFYDLTTKYIIDTFKSQFSLF